VVAPSRSCFGDTSGGGARTDLPLAKRLRPGAQQTSRVACLSGMKNTHALNPVKREVASSQIVPIKSSVEAPETTARVQSARRTRGGPEKDEARTTTAEGQQSRTAASTPEEQPTRTEPPAASTAQTSGPTGKGEPRREPAKATTPERGNGCWLEGIMFCPPGGEGGRRGGDVKGQGTAGMEAP
jgi:hypothetical protein